MYRVTLAKLIILSIGVSAHAASNRPAQPLGNAVSETMSVNTALRETYAETLKSNLHPDRLSALTIDLSENLSRLCDLDAPIADLAGFRAEGLRAQALTYRAMAWLHGWASFSQLVARASVPEADSVLRTRLLGPQSPVATDRSTALGLLLKIYKQMRQAEGFGKEPLQAGLSNISSETAFALAYRESWHDDHERGDITHEFYVPSAEDIVGHPIDSVRGQRNILSIWAVVNLQLDTWHGLAEGPFKVIKSLSKQVVASTDSELKLQSLIQWLGELTSNANLDSFDQARQLKARVATIAAFLTFRERYADKKELGNLVDRMATERLRSSQAFRDSIPPELLEAARPIPSAGRSESLFDAGIWLRYLVLLSYHKERSLVADDQAENALLSTWEKLEIGQPFELRRTSGSEQAPASSFLRWNKWPSNGHLSAVLADIVYVAKKYLDAEHHVEQMEKLRFQGTGQGRFHAIADDQMAPNYQLIGSYRQSLAKETEAMQGIFLQNLEAYFRLESTDAGSQKKDSDRYAGPQNLTDRNGTLSLAFRTSATSAEQSRIAGDLAALAGGIRSTLKLYSLLIQAYQSADAQTDPRAMAESVKSIAGLVSRSTWNIYNFPEKTFRDYYEDLKIAIGELKRKADLAEAGGLLRGRFQTKQRLLEAARFQALAARVGTEIAKKGKEINDLYLKVVKIDQEIAEYDRKVADLKKQAFDNKQESAGITLAYATRMRDLAAARVQALIDASDAAEKLAAQARRELTDVANNFTKTADDLKSAAARKRAFDILRTVVGVVGAALAPFTGGASLTVAGLLNTAIDVYDIASQTNWSHFESALTAIETIGSKLSKGVSVAIDKFGSLEDKKKLAELCNYLKSTRKEFDDKAKKLLGSSDTVIKVLQGLKTLTDKKDLVNFASAVANGFTLRVEKNQLRVDFPNKKVTFSSPALQRQLKALLDSGNIIVNDAAARARDLSALPGLPDHELKEKLYQAFKGAVTQLPPEMLEKLQIQVADAQNKGREALEGLRLVIENQIGPDERRILAQALAGGFLFAKEITDRGESVVLLERPLADEARRFQSRLQNYKEKIGQEVINGFLKTFEDRKNKLLQKGQRFAEGGDFEGLLNLRDTEIPREITGLDNQLAELQKTIEDAKGQLEDAESVAKVANYEAEAAKLFAQASELEVQESEMRRRRADFNSDISKEMLKTGLLQVDKEDALLKAALLNLEVCEIELRLAYEACLNHGINPLGPVDRDSSLGSDAAASIQGLLTGYIDGADVYRRWVLDQLAVSVLGMIKWVEILHLGSVKMVDEPSATPVELYARLVNAVTSRKPVYVEPLDQKTSIAGELSHLAAKIDLQVRSLGSLSTDIEYIKSDDIPAEKIIWRDDLSPGEQDKLLAGIETEWKAQIIGALKFRVDNVRQSEFDYTTVDGIKAEHYAIPLRTSLFAKASAGLSLSFQVQVPTDGLSHPAKLMVADRGSLLPPRSIDTDLTDEVLNEQLRLMLASWSEKLIVTGALGEWQFFILANGATAEDRKSIEARLKAKKFSIEHLRIGMIKVRLQPD